MTITNLKLINFRNHIKFDVQINDGVTLIVGQNGTGKTNILEAVNLLSTGKSFKARHDHEMIYDPRISGQIIGPGDVFDGMLAVKEFAKVMGTVKDKENEESLEITIVRENPDTNISQKTFKINGTPKPIYEISSYFFTVLFCPQDLDIFNGSPALRRRFLDDLLCKIDQRYKKEHIIYTKAVRQRNKVLEKISKTATGREELPFWTEKLLASGVYLQQKRVELIDTINKTIGQIYSDISPRATKISIDYKMNELNSERLEKHHEHEIYAKTTLVGPHRDDFDFLLSGFSISRYGSRGQQRTGVLSLKICELDVIKQKTTNTPVLLLDDIFSEFDSLHKKALQDITQRQQTIITSTHADIITSNSISL